MARFNGTPRNENINQEIAHNITKTILNGIFNKNLM